MICGESHDDHLVNRADKDFTAEVHSAHTIGNVGNCGVKVQLAAIVCRFGMAGKGQKQVAEGLIFHLFHRLAHHCLIKEFVSV